MGPGRSAFSLVSAASVSVIALLATVAPSFAAEPAVQPPLQTVKIAVMPLTLPRTLEADRTRLSDAAAAGLTASGAVAQVNDPAGCEYTLSGTVTRTKEQFSMRLVLVRASDGVEVDAASRACRDEYDLCPATVDIARDLAGRLARKLLLDLNTKLLTSNPVDRPGPATGSQPSGVQAGSPGSRQGAPVARDPGAQGGTPGVDLNGPGSSKPPEGWSTGKKVAATGAVVSALAIAAGAIMYFGLNDRPTDCVSNSSGGQICYQLWDTTAVSAVLAGVGLAGLGASSWYLWGRF